MNEIQKIIILNKCNERENLGYDNLTDSDIMDILEECERAGYSMSRKEIEKLFDNYDN